VSRNLHHITKKHLGQHWLTSPGIKKRILTACDLKPHDIVLEIGPGAGALTYAIAREVRQLFAVEKDARLVENLKQNLSFKNSQIFCADILTFDLAQLPGLSKIIGNLPYNIASPILGKLLEKTKLSTPMFFMVQYEFAKRMTAGPHSKDYGALSCFIQYFSQADMLFHIKPTAFKPRPKVMSSFVKVQPRIHVPQAKNEGLLFRVIRQAFQQRRKTVANALQLFLPKGKSTDIYSQLHINPKDRPENLSLDDYIHISNCLRA